MVRETGGAAAAIFFHFFKVSPLLFRLGQMARLSVLADFKKNEKI